MGEVIAALLGGGAGTAVVGLLIIRFMHSGRIDTTDAGSLWDEAHDLRESYRRDITTLNHEVQRLQEDIANRDQVIAALQQAMAEQEARHAHELAQLKAQHTREIGELGAQYSRQLADLRTELSKKEADRLALMSRVEELERRRSKEAS